MPTPTDQPPFGETPQTQPDQQAIPVLKPGYTTAALAERHEALWLSLAALYKDIIVLGAKKPDAPSSAPVCIAAEGLLSDCAAFTRKRRERLPVAAADLAGLAVQLGQALAGLEDWESRHTTWDERFNCRIWNLHSGYRPILRLNPPAAALKFERSNIDDLRSKLALRIDQRERCTYQKGFAAGRAARAGEPTNSPSPPAGEGERPPGEGAFSGGTQTYPRLRRLD